MDPLASFSGTVEGIYAAALEPARWVHALAQMAELLEAERGVVGFTSPGRPEIRVSLTHEIDPAPMPLWEEQFGFFDPWLQVAGALPCGTVVQGEQIIPWDELRRMEVHRAVFSRNRIDDLICAVVAAHEQSHDFVTVHRSRRKGPFERRHIEMLQRLVPHLVLAARIHERLCFESRANAIEEALLDTLPYGVVLLEPTGRILTTNRKARALLAAEDGLAPSTTGLAVAAPGPRAQLAAALGAGSGALLAIPRLSRRAPYTLLVCPVSEDTRERVFGSHPGRIGFLALVSDPAAPAQPAADALLRLFGLTPALSRLAAALAAGKTVREYADETKLSEGTVRQQLKELFARTGTSRQTELVRTMLASVASLVRPGAHARASL